MINREKLLERFIKYVRVHTKSNPKSDTFPSSDIQFDLAKILVEELKEIGVEDVELDKYGYVYGYIPSNVDYDVPAVGFLAHMDTSPDESGENVKPVIHKNYQGGDIRYDGNDELVLSPEGSPALKGLVGHDIVTSDGSTLLGADDKSGVAEIMTAVDTILSNPDIKHGPICIGFTPDEEIGKGVNFFDVKKFRADFAFTLDGGLEGELEDESFCADSADVFFEGINFHPGYAKNKMVNAVRMASRFVSLMDDTTLPETTEGREGYYHANEIAGKENSAKVSMIVRSFTEEGLKDREDHLNVIREKVLEEFPKGKIRIEIKEQYRNMKVVLDTKPEIMAIAEKAFEMSGIKKVIRKPIRGGTDGSRLTFMGLPTPNVFTGMANIHSRKEFISVQTMEKATEVIINIVRQVAGK